MLAELRVRDFAIIDTLALPLVAGFNVLTGETGAGKSIIAGALGLLIGERASTELIRTGAARAVVEGVFDASHRPELLAQLDARGIDVDGDTVVLRREIAANGRARAWINGTTTTAGALAEVGRELVTLHGQHDGQALLEAAAQQGILDEFAGAGDLVREVRDAATARTAVEQEMATLGARRAAAEQRADYLRHVAGEITAAHVDPRADALLEDEARRLEHAEELRALAMGIASALEGDEHAVVQRLASVQRSLATIARIDPALARLQELFDTGFYALEELSREIDGYAGSVDLDPERLGAVQARRDLLYGLTKKYGPSLADVVETGRRAAAELDLLDTADLDARALAERRDAAIAVQTAAARALSGRRAEAATRLEEAVDALLPSLGMPDGRFTVALRPRAEIAATGAEDVAFEIALNAGHEARPLARIASGGELSRIMLALETILARLERVPTLVFDEIDAGIGGRIGLQVGDAMRRVAGEHQVLAITHLPQIAARAHHHILVSKGARGAGGVTTADTRVVDGEARVAEIARMLGGDPESAVSQAHARELLEAATAGGGARGAAGRRSRAAAGRRGDG